MPKSLIQKLGFRMARSMVHGFRRSNRWSFIIRWNCWNNRYWYNEFSTSMALYKLRLPQEP